MAENETQDSVAVFTIDEIEELKKDPNIANHNRRSFLKWSAIVSSQAVIGGGLVNLLASSEVNADDTFDNVTDWVYSVCGYCSFGCGLNIGVNAAVKQLRLEVMKIIRPIMVESVLRVYMNIKFLMLLIVENGH